jgi:ABC-type dipeptide/oligopeptide/nickel transport system permease subunit
LIRNAIISQRSLSFVQSAKIAGSSELQNIFRHILPNIFLPFLVTVSLDIGNRILGLVCLSFLGFGPSGVSDWGRDISINYHLMETRPWAVIWPGIGITITVLGFKLIGDGLQKELDKKKITTKLPIERLKVGS